jgi:hypothetical protein
MLIIRMCSDVWGLGLSWRFLSGILSSET